MSIVVPGEDLSASPAEARSQGGVEGCTGDQHDASRSPAAVNRPLGPSNDDAKLLKVAQFRRGCQFVGLAFSGLERASRVGARLPVDRQCNGILSQTRGSSHQRLRCCFQGRTVATLKAVTRPPHFSAPIVSIMAAALAKSLIERHASAVKTT